MWEFQLIPSHSMILTFEDSWIETQFATVIFNAHVT